MSDWPGRTDRWGVHTSAISPLSPLSLGSGFGAVHGSASPVSAAWPAANRAILVPFRLPVIATAYQMIVGCGATASGNFDAGIYDWYGNLLVSSGTTAKVSGAEVVLNITDTVLGPGRYYMAVSVDGAEGMTTWTMANAFTPKYFGVRQATAAFVLPATVTLETVASGVVPSLVVLFKSQ